MAPLIRTTGTSSCEPDHRRDPGRPTLRSTARPLSADISGPPLPEPLNATRTLQAPTRTQSQLREQACAPIGEPDQGTKEPRGRAALSGLWLRRARADSLPAMEEPSTNEPAGVELEQQRMLPLRTAVPDMLREQLMLQQHRHAREVWIARFSLEEIGCAARPSRRRRPAMCRLWRLRPVRRGGGSPPLLRRR